MNIDTSSKSYAKKGKSSKGSFAKMEKKANSVKTNTKGSVIQMAPGMTKKQASSLPLANYSADKGATGPGVIKMSKGKKAGDEGASNVHAVAGVKAATSGKKGGNGKSKKSGEQMVKEAVQKYKIQSGDTLSEIAQRNSTTVARLMKANKGITDGNKIYAGQEINVGTKKKKKTTSVYKGYDLKTRKPMK